MVAALAALRNRVEQYLVDTGNAIWATGLIDEGLRLALAEWSRLLPRRLDGTVTPGSETREIDVSSITGLLDAVRIWTPYTVASPEHPPNWRTFEFWRDSDVVYLLDHEVGSSDVVRVFYTIGHTVEDLDSAAATTLNEPEESVLVVGAAGHASTSRGLDTTEQVTLGRATAVDIRGWGEARLSEFRAQLEALAINRGIVDGGLFPYQDGLDRWDQDWS